MASASVSKGTFQPVSFSTFITLLKVNGSCLLHTSFIIFYNLLYLDVSCVLCQIKNNYLLLININYDIILLTLQNPFVHSYFYVLELM